MPKSRSNGPPTVERKIYFYRVDAGIDEGGRPLAFNPTRTLQLIDTLPFSIEGRYWQGKEGNASCCWVDHATSKAKLRYGQIRRSSLPLVETGGSLKPLSIPLTSGLAEQIHVVFFPGQIVGSEFNFYGPRVSQLGPYLATIAKDTCPPLRFQPLLRKDIFQLRIRPAYASVIAEADENLGRAFEAAAKAGDAEELELTLKPKARSNKSLGRKMLNTVAQLVRNNAIREEASAFIVSGQNEETGKVDTVDLLGDKLIAKKQIILRHSRTRAVDKESAYEAIEAAY